MKKSSLVKGLALLLAAYYAFMPIGVYAQDEEANALTSTTEEYEVEDEADISSPYSTVESVEEAMNGVIQVNTVFQDKEGNKHIICGGAGILIGSADGTEYVITTNHIIHVSDETQKAAFKYYKIPNKNKEWDNIKPYSEVVFENDVTVSCTVVNSSENLDLCVLQLASPNHNRTPLTLLIQDKGSKEKPFVTTDSVYGLGYPEGITYENAVCYSNKQVSMSSGKIANVTSYNGADLIQHNAQISDNNCGGPLLNENGLVIGMNELMDDGNNFYSLDSTDISNILDSLGIEYNKLTQTEYEAWLHRNDAPVEIPISTYHGDFSKKNNYSSIVILVVLVVSGLIIVSLVIFLAIRYLKKNKGIKPKEKSPEPKFLEKEQENKPDISITVNKDNVETGALETTIVSDQTTLLSPGNSVTSSDPLITSGTLVRRKNSDNIIIDKLSFSIGKDSLHVDYCIKDNPAISRTHALIVTQNNQVFLQDNHSTNGTFVNNKRLQAGDMELIKNGDVIKFADEEYQYRI